MKSKNLIILIIILLVALAVGAFYLAPFIQKIDKGLFFTNTQPKNTPSNFTVQDKQITDNAKPFVVKIVYPQITGLNALNEKISTLILKELNDFKANSLANDEAVKKVDPVGYAKYPREYDLNISYTKGEVDENIVSVILSVYNFEGGAHGESYFVPINYNVKTKKDIQLADLFPGQPDYLQKISDFCTADLTKQLTKALGSLDGTYLKDGAGPNADNFQFFLINPSTRASTELSRMSSGQATITFYFPQYQVAYGAAGDFQVTMPR